MKDPSMDADQAPVACAERPRVLTDVQIHQDELWTNTTDFLDGVETRSLGAVGRWLDRRSAEPGVLLRALKLLVHQADYDAVVTSSLRTAQVYGFLRTLCRVRTPAHVHLELWLDEERNSFAWKLKRAFQRAAFASTDLLVTSARAEIDTYSERLGLPRDRFRFVFFHTNVLEPGAMGGEGGYAFAAGKTGRDYELLARAAVESGVDLVVLGDAASLRGVEFPPNVTVLTDEPYDRYLELLHGCDFVIVPLNDAKSSRGQVVMLEAMAVGKPVIATETVGTVDYVETGDNGILVAPSDVDSLRSAIHRLGTDAVLRARLSKRALEQMKRHTFRRYVETILEHVQDAVSKQEA
ncbi:MAG: glycosyltransferase family 4 protein [Myxococcota bacterium]